MAFLKQVIEKADSSEGQESDERIKNGRRKKIPFKECGDRRTDDERDAPDDGSSFFVVWKSGRYAFAVVP